MRILVSGGDAIGLIAAYVFRSRGHTVIIEEDGEPGTEFKSPGFRFVERTSQSVWLLEQLGLLHDAFTVSIGIMLRGRVEPLRGRISDAVHHAHWSKTKLISRPATGYGLVDPEAGACRQAIQFDWGGMLRPLLRGATIVREAKEPVDFVVETRPLWESRFIESEAVAATLNLVPIVAGADRYMKWDVVYTPFTPANSIHRIYHSGSGYICECAGAVREHALASDLNFLFPEGWHLDGPIHATSGALLPLHTKPTWPTNVRPLGRYAQWDDRMSIARVIRDALLLAAELKSAR